MVPNEVKQSEALMYLKKSYSNHTISLYPYIHIDFLAIIRYFEEKTTMQSTQKRL